MNDIIQDQQLRDKNLYLEGNDYSQKDWNKETDNQLSPRFEERKQSTS